MKKRTDTFDKFKTPGIREFQICMEYWFFMVHMSGSCYRIGRFKKVWEEVHNGNTYFRSGANLFYANTQIVPNPDL